MFEKIIIILLLVIFQTKFVFPKQTFPIALILNGLNVHEEIAFRATIERINIYERNFQFEGIIKVVNVDDFYNMEKIVCDLLSKGVIAIFGPSSSGAGIVSSISNAFDIPHITYHWTPEETILEREQRVMTLNVFPNSVDLSRGYADFLTALVWKSFTVVYENDNDLIQLQDVLQVHGPDDNPVTVRKLDDHGDYRPLLKQLKGTGDSCIILHCSLNKILTVLRQAQEVKMLTDYHSFFISAIDVPTTNFEEMLFTPANITAVRFFDPTDHEVRTAVHDWEQREKLEGRDFEVLPEHITTSMVLLHDALWMFSRALKDLNMFSNMNIPKVNCRKGEPWRFGRSIIEFIRNRTHEGVTGHIEFNKYGQRTNFTLRLLELTSKGFHQLSVWDPVNKIGQMFSSTPEYEQQLTATIQNKTFIVASRIGSPFLDYRQAKEGEILEGNALFEGYSLDLIDSIAKHVGFKYLFYITPDNKYGAYNPNTKQWDGLVRQILDGKADLALCDLTMTSARRTAVDFSSPFMTLGISILYAKPANEPPDLFSFLSPFSLSVWLYMATAYLAMSLLLFILSRMAPDDWENPHPCNEEPEELENLWTIPNTTWLTMGSIMGQGCDILPKAYSTRLAAGMWWFFALMMLNSYTANLAAFLTMSRMDSTIESAEDLAKQTKIKYGAVEGGSTLAFFRDSNHSMYQKMWAAMESARPSVFTKSNDEGVERVLKGKRQYAFFMESTSIEYRTERKCDLTQVGGLLDYKSYGIAMPFNSKYRSVINQAVLKLGESGKLYELKKKWWKEMHGGGACSKGGSEEAVDANELGIQNVGGVFLVLGIGLFIALVIGIGEFLWNVRTVAVDNKITPKEAFKSELEFALKFWVTNKPVSTSNASESSRSKQSSKSRSRAASVTRSNTHTLDPSLHNSSKSLQSLKKLKDKNFLI